MESYIAAIRSGTTARDETDEVLSPAVVPVDRTDKTDVHDFRDQLKSMGACKYSHVRSCSLLMLCWYIYVKGL